MTWGIVAGLITICGVLIALGGVLWKLAVVITRLEVTLNVLDKASTKNTEENAAEHKEFNSKLDDHDKRIFKLETKEEKH